MVNKIFLDTNIVVDVLLKRNYELDAIQEIFRLGEKEKIDLYISESIIINTFYIAKKYKVDTLSFFREICNAVNIIPFSKEILYYPVEKYQDTEDGLLYFLATTAKINYFITRNVKDFVFLFPTLPVMSPTNFLKEIYFNDLSK